ncbi:hypothetical protein PV325_012828, partial [Microctonus aethiopoides]
NSLEKHGGIDEELIKLAAEREGAKRTLTFHLGGFLLAPELYNDIIKRRHLVIKNATVDSEIDHNFLQSKRSCYTTPKRNVFEPRYISEIRTPDFGTPR